MADLFREYEPLWNLIKANGTAAVIANARLHSRIIKAITKEKWKDVGFKLKISPEIGYLSSKSSGSTLVFTLTKEIRSLPDRRTKRLGVKVLIRNL